MDDEPLNFGNLTATRPTARDMPTSIHVSKALLAALDREAARRGLSRNRLITEILTLAVRNKDDFPPWLFVRLHESALEGP